jgi:hypothetical protein
MNFHIGTATGIGGGAQGFIIGTNGFGWGYFILTEIVVVSFGIFGAAFTLAGGQAGPTQAGAAAGITVGVGAGIAPE